MKSLMNLFSIPNADGLIIDGDNSHFRYTDPWNSRLAKKTAFHKILGVETGAPHGSSSNIRRMEEWREKAKRR
jgi:hypothetical protein